MPTSRTTANAAPAKKNAARTRAAGSATEAVAAAAPVRRAEAAADAGTLQGTLRQSLAKIPKTGELIARELRKRIIRGELGEGASLPSEAELMGQLSVSRASLREALRILESESLLTVKRGSRGGPIVHRPDPNLAARYFGLVLQANDTSLEDVYMARLLIEPPAVRVVIERARRKVPPVILELLETGRDAVKQGDGTAFLHQTARFHDALIELTGNKTLMLVMHILNIIFEHHMEAIDQAGPAFDRAAASRSGIRAQERLAELIVEGDADAAVAHWRAHLLNIKALMFGQRYVGGLIDVV